MTRGWERCVGLDGLAPGVDAYGPSAPASNLDQRFGLSAVQVMDG